MSWKMGPDLDQTRIRTVSEKPLQQTLKLPGAAALGQETVGSCHDHSERLQFRPHLSQIALTCNNHMHLSA